MQRHRYSMTAFLPSVFTLGGIAVYTVMYGLPSIYIFLICAVISYVLYRLIDAYRNKYYRQMHRTNMSNALIVLPNFRVDENYQTEYNGFMIQIDHLRGQVALVDSELHVERIHFKDIVACYYKADIQKQLKSNGGEMVRAEDTYNQLSLIIETKIPDKHHLSYLCFDAWNCTGYTKSSVKASDKRLVQTLEEVQVAIERLEAIKE